MDEQRLPVGAVLRLLFGISKIKKRQDTPVAQAIKGVAQFDPLPTQMFLLDPHGHQREPDDILVKMTRRFMIDALCGLPSRLSLMLSRRYWSHASPQELPGRRHPWLDSYLDNIFCGDA